VAAKPTTRTALHRQPISKAKHATKRTTARQLGLVPVNADSSAEAHNKHHQQVTNSGSDQQQQQCNHRSNTMQGSQTTSESELINSFFIPLAAEVINKAAQAAAQQRHKQQHHEPHAGSSNFDSWRSHAFPSANSWVHLLLFLWEEKEDRSQLIGE
jgi:hypothetical protein